MFLVYYTCAEAKDASNSSSQSERRNASVRLDGQSMKGHKIPSTPPGDLQCTLPHCHCPRRFVSRWLRAAGLLVSLGETLRPHRLQELLASKVRRIPLVVLAGVLVVLM